MSHFTYDHFPASGLGHRDPRRPHVTGGIGAGVRVFRLLLRIFSSENRRMATTVGGINATESRENRTSGVTRKNPTDVSTVKDFE